MSTEEQYDGFDGFEGLGGGVHGLLATAFDGDVPLVNLIPAAVDGYRLHRRRTRVLGTAGGALALAGVAVAGTALASTPGSTASTRSSASGGHESASGGSATIAVDPLCQGIHDPFSLSPASRLYTADNATLTRVCSRDLAALRSAIPGATVSPRRETYEFAVAHHDAQPGDPLPSGATAQTPLTLQGRYVVKVGAVTTEVTLDVTDRLGWGFDGCGTTGCPPDMKLADGTPATESPASASAGISVLSVHPDAGHWVEFMASAQGAPKQQLPFDFAKVVRSQPFAAAVAGDVHDLTQLD